MRGLSYRRQSQLKKVFRWFCFVLLALIVLFLLYMLYLQRYIVYTKDGAHLDFSRSTLELSSSSSGVNKKTEALHDVEIKFIDEPVVIGGTLAKIDGYYITSDMLKDDAAQVLEAVKALDAPCPIMLDVKDYNGRFLYPSNITGAEAADLDLDVVEELLSYLRQNQFSMIACLPAFSDSAFALEHLDCGLSIEGGALWMDENGCYWLDPSDQTVLTYIEQICKELTSMGFSEVAFSQFYFPDSNDIVYQSTQTKSELIASAAKTIQDVFAESHPVISFFAGEPSFPTNAIHGRLYYENIEGPNIESVLSDAEAYVQDTSTQIVFITDSQDSRLDGSSVMRPLISQDEPDEE